MCLDENRLCDVMRGQGRGGEVWMLGIEVCVFVVERVEKVFGDRL